MEQLLQYKMYKYIAFELKDRQLDADLVLFRKSTIPEEVREYEEPVDLDALLADVTVSRLGRIFRDVMKRQNNKIDPVRKQIRQDRKGGSAPSVQDRICGGLCETSPEVQLPAASGRAEEYHASGRNISCDPGIDEDRGDPGNPGKYIWRDPDRIHVIKKNCRCIC